MNMLIRKARMHDKAAFQQLMEQQGKAMYKVARAILKNDEDVADAMQETALACWEKIDTLKQDKYFSTWLTRILINNCNSIYRQRMRTMSDTAAPELLFHEDGYTNVEWETFLNCLDEKYRTVLLLYYVQGFKTKEIAEILQVNENTVRGRLVTARKRLEAQYHMAETANPEGSKHHVSGKAADSAPPEFHDNTFRDTLPQNPVPSEIKKTGERKERGTKKEPLCEDTAFCSMKSMI